MARFQSAPVVATQTTWWKATGKVTKAIVEVATEVDQLSTKAEQDLPAFKPGVFLIKPYSVSSRRIECDEQTLVSPKVETIDRFVQSKFEGRVNARKVSLDALDWTFTSQTQTRAYLVHKALSKVNDAVWDSMVDLAELYSTYQLLRKPTDRLVDVMGDILGSAIQKSKKKAPDVAGVLLAIADGTFDGKRMFAHMQRQKKTFGGPKDGFKKSDIEAYNKAVDYFNGKLLEYRYGWLPLVSSIQDALAALQASLLRATQQIKTARSRFEKDETSSSLGPWATQYTQVRRATNYRMEGIAYYQRTLDQRMIDLIGLKPENIPQTAWEATRLSFVLDWFIGVGTWLDAMKPEYGIKILGTSSSQKTIITNTWSCQWSMGDAAVPPLRSAVDSATATSFDRTIGSVQTYPAITGLDRMTPLRWADAAALSFKPLRKLAQALKRS